MADVSTVAASERVSSHPFREAVPFAVVVFVCMRLVLSLMGALTVGRVHVLSDATSSGAVSAAPGWHNVLDGTERWDALRFEQIAADGYEPTDGSPAFFPGYPLAIRVLLVATPLAPVTAATIVSNLAFFGALVALYALTAREYSRDKAQRTLILMACFPTSFFFLAPYSESLYLLATLVAFWWARAERWPRAGMAGIVATLTRSAGIVLVPALTVEAWRRGPDGRARRIAFAALPLLSIAGLAIYWSARTGDPLEPLHAQAAWMRSLMPFPVTIGRAIVLGAEGIGDAKGVYWSVDLILTALLLVPLAIHWRAVPLSYLVYAGVLVLLVLSYPLPARPLLSDPRLLLVLFPAFWAMADMLRGRAFLVATLLFGVGFVGLSSAFMNWGYVF
jgi:hypothetical protein